jgi:hypothetical protein
VNDKLRQDNNDSHFDRTKSHGCWICFVRISIVALDETEIFVFWRRCDHEVILPFWVTFWNLCVRRVPSDKDNR